MLAGILTGLRKANLLGALPEWIKETDRGPALSLPQTKTGGRFLVALSPEALELLKRCLPWDTTEHKVRTAFEKAREHLAWTKENDLHFTFHGTRHTFGTWQMEAGTDARIIQSMMGHASIQTTQIYLTVTAGLRQEAAGRISLPQAAPTGTLSTPPPSTIEELPV